MMKRRFVLVSAALLFAGPLTAQTVLTFDDLVGGVQALPSNYGGVSWDNGWSAYDFAQPPYNPASGNSRVFFCSTCGDGGATFASPVTFLGAYFSGYDVHPETGAGQTIWFELFLGGNPVFTSGTLVPTSVAAFLASGYNGNVDRVVAHTSFDLNLWVMDDFTFQADPSSTVPEPATMTLLATGLAGMAAARRRKKA